MSNRDQRERGIRLEIGKLVDSIIKQNLREKGETLRFAVVLKEYAEPTIQVVLHKRHQAKSIEDCFELTTQDWQEVLKLPWGPKTRLVVERLHERRENPPSCDEMFFGKRLGYWFTNLNGVFCKHNAPFRIKGLTPHRRDSGKTAQIVRTDDESSAE